MTLVHMQQKSSKSNIIRAYHNLLKIEFYYKIRFSGDKASHHTLHSPPDTIYSLYS